MDKKLLKTLVMEITGGYPVEKPQAGNAAITFKANNRGFEYSDIELTKDGCFVKVEVPARFQTDNQYVGKYAWVKTASPFHITEGYVDPGTSGVIPEVEIEAFFNPDQLPDNWNPEYDGEYTYTLDASHLDLIPVAIRQLGWQKPGSTFVGMWALGYEFRYHLLGYGFLPRKMAESAIRPFSKHTFGNGAYWRYYSWTPEEEKREIEEFVKNHPSTIEAIKKHGYPKNGFRF